MDIRKTFCSERVVMQWHRLPRKVMESLSLEVLKNHGDVALRNMISGHGGDGLGLDLVILQLFSNLNDSVILCTRIWGQLGWMKPKQIHSQK